MKPTNEATAAGTEDGQLALLRSLAGESAEKLERMRRVQIPQHVGMAAAGRALAIDLPKALVAQIQAGLTSGALDQRWAAALKRAGTEAEAHPAATLTALAAPHRAGAAGGPLPREPRRGVGERRLPPRGPRERPRGSAPPARAGARRHRSFARRGQPGRGSTGGAPPGAGGRGGPGSRGG